MSPRRPLLALALLALLAGSLLAQGTPPAPELPTFVPSERLPAGSAVSFPADI